MKRQARPEYPSMTLDEARAFLKALSNQRRAAAIENYEAAREWVARKAAAFDKCFPRLSDGVLDKRQKAIFQARSEGVVEHYDIDNLLREEFGTTQYEMSRISQRIRRRAGGYTEQERLQLRLRRRPIAPACR